jgi:hypothetical protein
MQAGLPPVTQIDGSAAGSLTNAVGVSVNGNYPAKTTADNWGDGGASSANHRWVMAASSLQPTSTTGRMWPVPPIPIKDTGDFALALYPGGTLQV